MQGLSNLRVVDFSREIAGPYCTKLLVDAGAEVIKVESADGDPMRRWSSTGASLRGEDGALFRFLNAGKQSVIGALGDEPIRRLVTEADLVVEDFAADAFARESWLEAHPGLTWLSISPYGMQGPWSTRPTTEFILQAEAGSIGTRGLPGEEPFQAGGRIAEWLGGTFASVAALAAVYRAQRTGLGEHVDFSLLEVMNCAGSNYADLFFRLLGLDELPGPAQSVETPSIEPTRDGYVGFCTNTAQQFSDFLLLIQRPDLREDKSLFQVMGRMKRFAEWNEIVRGFTSVHTTAEIVEAASLLRIPVAPVNDAAAIQEHPQLRERCVFMRDNEDRFTQPRPPYIIDDRLPPAPRQAPSLGEHSGCIESRGDGDPFSPSSDRSHTPSAERRLPLEGLRIVDMTAWWAGPSATHMLAALGADVIHVESIQRIDGMRLTGGSMRGKVDNWWEYSAFFLAANANKRGITLNLNDERGVSLLKRLVVESGALVENFTPRVIEGFGLGWETLHAINPRLIMVRMPAFGLSGPWRNHTGFAQTMEQMTGMAWLTGHRDDQPRIQRGPCDPLAGMHAAFALILALFEREATGQGKHVEVTMVEGALNAAAEMLVEYTAYGGLMSREGNRSAKAAPQGLYACVGHRPGAEQWLALSVASDAQWRALRGWLGEPAWAKDSVFDDLAGRRAEHDRLDRELGRVFAELDVEGSCASLVADGIAAGRVVDPRRTSAHPQLIARHYFEEVLHEEVGAHLMPSVPFRYASVPRWIHSPAPTLGEHNDSVLGDLLGLEEDELAELALAGVIGTRPKGL